MRDFFAYDLINPDVPSHQGWFSFQNTPLKWQYPTGLLLDLLAGCVPEQGIEAAPQQQQNHSKMTPTSSSWDLNVHFSDWPAEQLLPLDATGKLHQDAFFQSVKEADYLRNGSAKTIMMLSKEDSTALWESVVSHDLSRFAPLYQRFLNPRDDRIRHVPMKLYIPQAPPHGSSQANVEHSAGRPGLRVIQGLVSPSIATSKVPQTLGTALHGLLPKLFPSRTLAIHARPVLHGVIVPLNTKVEELMADAAFCDGFLHISVTLMPFENQPITR